jgi:hypothetical protein
LPHVLDVVDNDKNKTHQFDLRQGQVGINIAKIQLIFLIASVF